jgi:uncharacterized protein (DUF433 family)
MIHDEGVRPAVEQHRNKGAYRLRQFERITFEPGKMGGRACIGGLRVTVSLVVNLSANGMTPAQIVEAYPYLELEDVRQALQYAAWLASETILPIEPTPA